MVPVGGQPRDSRAYEATGSTSAPTAASPTRPAPPKTAFMCFSIAKERELHNLDGSPQNPSKLRRVADAWRGLSPRDRAFWEEEARKDKMRYAAAKENYTGWAIPKRRAKKHPLAPKRPMSAFLKYSQTRRALVKGDNPDCNNTDISKILGEMWKTEKEEEKNKYRERELEERAAYKEAIAKWRMKHEKEEAAKQEIEQPHPHYRGEAHAPVYQAPPREVSPTWQDPRQHDGRATWTDLYHAAEYHEASSFASSQGRGPHPYNDPNEAQYASYRDSSQGQRPNKVLKTSHSSLGSSHHAPPPIQVLSMPGFADANQVTPASADHRDYNYKR